jgi:hypothetical protein
MTEAYLASGRYEHASVDALHGLDESRLVLGVIDMNLHILELCERLLRLLGEDERAEKSRLSDVVIAREKQVEDEAPSLALGRCDEDLAFGCLGRRALLRCYTRSGWGGRWQRAGGVRGITKTNSRNTVCLMRSRHQYIWSSGFSRTRVHDRPRRCIIVLVDTNEGLELTA